MPTTKLEGLDLTPDNPASDLVIHATYEKQPMELKPGMSPAGSVEIDAQPSELMKKIAAEAAELQALPELKRLHAVMDLLREHLDYPYDWNLDFLRDQDPDRAQWVEQNIVGKEAGLKLSEVFDHGYAACSQMTTAYMWLAQSAGLKGTLQITMHDQIRNINRAGTNEPLFKATAPGKMAPAHAWNEILTEARGWVPVDPSIKYIGDTDERLQIFKDAGYQGVMIRFAVAKARPSEYVEAATRILPALPGSETVEVTTRARLHGPIMTLGSKEGPRPPKHQTYKGDATIDLIDDTTPSMGLKFSGFDNIE